MVELDGETVDQLRIGGALQCGALVVGQKSLEDVRTLVDKVEDKDPVLAVS